MLRWKLKDYLDRHHISAYALTKAADVAPNTVYGLARGDHERISLRVLDKVIVGLETLTGQSVSVADLLEREEHADAQAAGAAKLSAAGIPYTGDLETDEVLDAMPDILERIARLEVGKTKLVPLREIAAKYGVER